MTREQLLYKLKNDMLLFGATVIPTMFTQKSPKFHREICDLLHNEKLKNINIQAPRGSAKTSIIGCIFPLHHIMFDTRGPKVVVLASKTRGHAELMLRSICDVFEYSMPFRQLFGYWGQHSARKWTNTEVVLKDGTYIVCKGTGQQIRGLKYGQQRPTLILIDDPEDENNTKTAEAMENNLKWVLQAAVPSRDAHRGRVIVIGTPLHERCIVKVLENASHWESRVYRYINTDEYGKEYSLWPEQKSLETLKAERAGFEDMGKLSMFYREFQCELVGDEDQLFRPDDFRYWKGRLEKTDDGNILVITHLNKQELETPIKRPVNVFMGVDPASSVKQTADFSTIVTVAMDAKKNRYILPYYRRRATPLVFAQSIIAEYQKYNPTRTRIETTGYQEMLREYVRSESESMGIYIAGLEVGEKPRQDKSSRLESLQPFFGQHKMYLPQDSCDDLEAELLMYPRSKHDDLMDGLYYACKSNYPTLSETPEELKREMSGIEEIDYFPTLSSAEYEETLSEDAMVA